VSVFTQPTREMGGALLILETGRDSDMGDVSSKFPSLDFLASTDSHCHDSETNATCSR
jgi:hypothetical protein